MSLRLQLVRVSWFKCAVLLMACSFPITLGVAQQQPAKVWDRYTVTDAEFSVRLPRMPAMSSYSVPEEDNKSSIKHILGVYSQATVYSVWVYQRKESLDNVFQRFVGSKSKFTRALDVAAGKEYVSEYESGKVTTQIFMTKRYLYVFEAHRSTLMNSEDETSKFFDSIKFGKDSQSLVVVNGPGEEPPAAPGASTEVLSGRQVTQKARILLKPEPTYTELARQRQTTGTVVLKCVFSSSGQVTNITLISGVPDGLTDKAIAAARQIKYIPAVKDGRFVSMYFQLEYNFNLY